VTEARISRVRPARGRAGGGLLAGIVAGLAAVALSACGGSAPPPARVGLHVGSPGDGAHVLQSTVTVSGTVSASVSSVQVLGHSVPVSHGAFSVKVALNPGTNMVDVLAGAHGAQAAMSVVRVVRELQVPVPDLIGSSPATAQQRLTAMHLGERLEKTSYPLDFLVPRPYQVCSTSPAPGQPVPPASTVTVTISKTC
jgi:Glucodextranase, domain B/PASTA domain